MVDPGPAGRRGACPAVRSTGYGTTDWAAHASRVNESLCLVPLVESLAGLNDAPLMAACPQVRALFIGAFDLAAEVGSASTDLRSPLLRPSFESLARVAAEHNKPLMASVGTDPDPVYVDWLKYRGVRLFSTGADVQTVRAAAARAQCLRHAPTFKEASCK